MDGAGQLSVDRMMAGAHELCPLDQLPPSGDVAIALDRCADVGAIACARRESRLRMFVQTSLYVHGPRGWMPLIENGEVWDPVAAEERHSGRFLLRATSVTSSGVPNSDHRAAMMTGLVQGVLDLQLTTERGVRAVDIAPSGCFVCVIVSRTHINFTLDGHTKSRKKVPIVRFEEVLE